MTWFAIYTAPAKEHLVDRWLRNIGHRTLFPHTPEWRGLNGRKSYLVKKPYFPRYLFIQPQFSLGNTLYAMLSVGLGRIVHGADQMPVSVPDLALQALEAICDPLGAVHDIDAPVKRLGLYRGNQFKVAEGNPLWGMVATIEAVDENAITATIGGLFGRVMISPDQVGELIPSGDNAGSNANVPFGLKPRGKYTKAGAGIYTQNKQEIC